ncbi:MAG: hypothetical protein CBE00_04265 [Planctomycetaceae bacterium TMED240]|nr:hypothetical protein [Rhodopirellula sp.]OUX07614.1 MAG: hypothetical protein CBE00_04265 [Planctomycetaceae bacterium TMED240]
MNLDITARLKAVASRLIDQDQAQVIVPPQRPGTGHWFGGGNMVQDQEGTLWLTGRFRNQGDSRTGLGAGERGLELAIYRSDDNAQTFQQSLTLSKADLNVGTREVLSIEGAALRFIDDRVELFVSTEKQGMGYPEELSSHLKPGTGVWTIDRLVANSMAQLSNAAVETVLETDDPRFLHIKDPFLGSHEGADCLLFCTHPFCWTSSNTGYVLLDDRALSVQHANLTFFPRGFTWDVAMTRGTALVNLPRVGVLADQDVQLLFYDGGECVRDLDQHATAVKRPRGYSCEELGGVAYCQNGDLNTVQRLSVNHPMFVSPHGTGCSRYVDVLVTADHYIVTWQQSQDDFSQPLVMNMVPRAEIEALLIN